MLLDDNFICYKYLLYGSTGRVAFFLLSKPLLNTSRRAKARHKNLESSIDAAKLILTFKCLRFLLIKRIHHCLEIHSCSRMVFIKEAYRKQELLLAVICGQ